mmetsp:Transcript_11927/g.28955  ORF Transcript_11927/g.28955 Transcript_11927/m.28955 type:complete len:252 (+) Transcript_11927:63-818(+)
MPPLLPHTCHLEDIASLQPQLVGISTCPAKRGRIVGAQNLNNLSSVRHSVIQSSRSNHWHSAHQKPLKLDNILISRGSSSKRDDKSTSRLEVNRQASPFTLIDNKVLLGPGRREGSVLGNVPQHFACKGIREPLRIFQPSNEAHRTPLEIVQILRSTISPCHSRLNRAISRVVDTKALKEPRSQLEPTLLGHPLAQLSHSSSILLRCHTHGDCLRCGLLCAGGRSLQLLLLGRRLLALLEGVEGILHCLLV